MSELLSKEDFLSVIRNAPIVSIDLLATCGGKVLVGLRRNSPLKKVWFVPGGRVLKDETIEDAFLRVTESELGIPIPIERARLHGVYTHKYPNETLLDEGPIDVHYVSLAYRFHLDIKKRQLPKTQHSKYRWLTPDEIVDDPDIHLNTKLFFDRGRDSLIPDSHNSDIELLSLYNGYQSSVARYTSTVWQFPTALLALNLGALAAFFKTPLAMLPILLLNFVFLQALFKLVANQRSIIKVTRNIECELRARINRPPGGELIPDFNYSWPLRMKSGRLLPWSLFIVNVILIGVILAIGINWSILTMP